MQEVIWLATCSNATQAVTFYNYNVVPNASKGVRQWRYHLADGNARNANANENANCLMQEKKEKIKVFL